MNWLFAGWRREIDGEANGEGLDMRRHETAVSLLQFAVGVNSKLVVF